MTLQNLPRLLYISDVPVESTVAGSALIYRLLQNYPIEKLKIIEGNIGQSSNQSNRLPNVDYEQLNVGRKRLINSRFSSLYNAYLLLTAKQRVSQLRHLVNEFKPDAILTVAHGFSWITAAKLAEQLQLPLHVIIHDNWIQTVNLPPQLLKRAENIFSGIYKSAKSRFCVSPYMAEEYEKLYNAKGIILYPSRAPDAPDYNNPSSRIYKVDNTPLVLGYAGSINHSGYIKALLNLASVLESMDGKLIIYSTLSSKFIKQMGLNKSNISFRAFIPSRDLIHNLRNEVDILFLPMVYEQIEPEPTSNVKICLPSKLTDYTATGLPILIWGPAYCSAVRWAKDNLSFAEVVENNTLEVLESSLTKLYKNREYRFCLATKALSIGKKYFLHNVIVDKFCQAIIN